MAKGFVDYLRAALGWWSSPPVVPVVPVDFVCIDTATLRTAETVATLGTAYALASGATCEGAATMGVPFSRARLYSPRSIAFQRPC